MLQTRMHAKVDKKSELKPSGVQVVHDLGTVFARQNRNSLDFDDDIFVAEKICPETMFKKRRFVKKRQINLRFERNVASRELDLQCLLENRLRKPAPEFIVNLEAGTNDLVGLGFI